MIINKLVIDIDGVLTTGHMIYSNAGKTYKVFGPHDKDGLKLISKYIDDITFITADKTGFEITHARIVKDWKFREDQLVLVSEEYRLEWFMKNCNLNTTAYIADGYHDAPILEKVALGIAPNTARIEARNSANYVTPSAAANGAVLDACLYIERVINGLETI